MQIIDLLSRGYLPAELPPPFTTTAFGMFVTSSAARPAGYPPSASAKPIITKQSVHSLVRAGSLRRRLGIPNPIAYEQLSTAVVHNWASLLGYAKKSPISLTTPQDSAGTVRAIVPTHSFDSWAQQRVRIRAGKRFVLKADISTFYGSVYTHSIPWAIHGKTHAKASRGLGELSNLLDAIIRNGQDQQTIGMPIGPDTSLLFAEILLSSIDARLPSGMTNGIRYIDDYEFGFATQAEAERCLAVIQQHLSEFELQLNSTKTKILSLPLPIEDYWIPEIRPFQIRQSASGQATDLLGFFGKAFQLQPSFPEDSLLKYAVQRTRSEPIQKANWSLYEALLLQIAAVEPGTLSAVVAQLVRYFRAGFPIGLDRVTETLNQTISTFGILGHGSEVAWALWGAIELGCKIGPNAAASLSASDDSIVALLALDARSRGLIPLGLDTTRWESLLVSHELRGSSWLLAYEAACKGWLKSPGGSDFIAKDDYFSWLRSGGVAFYEPTRTLNVPQPSIVANVPNLNPTPTTSPPGAESATASKYALSLDVSGPSTHP